MKRFYPKCLLVVFPRARLVAAVATGLLFTAALLPQAGIAAVEFVTPIGTCNKVDTIGDGKDLSLQAGNDVRFEVWGDGIDVNPAVRVTVDDANVDTLVTARILRAHNGVENLGRGCRIAKGSVEVEVDSPDEAGITRQRSLRFRMPLGDESRLQTRVVPFRTPIWKFTNPRTLINNNSRYVLQNPQECLTKNIGTVVRDLDDTRITITLPSGAAADTSTCALEFNTTVTPSDRPKIDIQKPFGYGLTVPAVMTLISGSNTADGALDTALIRFTGNVANIRRITARNSSTLTVRTPNNRTDTLTLVINPPPVTNAFTQGCQCRNAVTGTTINVGDAFDCELRLSQIPPATGQLITFLINDRACVAPGGVNVNYGTLANCTGPDGDGYGTYTAPNTGTIHRIPFRALGCNTSTGGACASNVSPVAHTLKFWVGQADTESGHDFTSCQIQIRRP
jgi:hypothetical protein